MNNKLNYSSLLFISLLTSFQVFSQIGIQKHHLYGGSQFDKSNKVMITSSGDRMIVGSTESKDGDFNDAVLGNDFDLFVMVTDEQNNLLWTRTYGGSQFESGIDMIETDNGDFIILAETNSNNGDVTNSLGSKDAWLLKLNNSGDVIWQKTVGGNGFDHASKIITLPNGNLALFGYSSSTNLSGTISLGDKDGWICLLDNSGNVLTHNLIGGSDFDLLSDAIVSQNEILVVGSTNSYDNNNDGAIHFGGFDHWMVSVGFDGLVNWERTYGGSGNDFCERLVSDDQGGFVTLGSLYSSVAQGDNSDDITVNHFNNLGNILWKRTFGGSSKDVGNGIVKVGDDYLVACTTSSNDGGVNNSFGGLDNWFLLLNESGALKEEYNRGGLYDDQLVDLIPTNDPSVFVVLGYSETMYLESNGGFDIEIFELTLNANQVGTTQLSNSSVSVFPNPTVDFVTVNTNGQNLGTLTLIDNTGKTVALAAQDNSGKYTFNVAGFKNGAYYIQSENLNTPIQVVKF